MTHYTPLREHRNGRVHLSPDVLRLDDRRRIYRRRHPWQWTAADIVFRFGIPAVLVLLCAATGIGLLWIVLAIGRAIRFAGGF